MLQVEPLKTQLTFVTTDNNQLHLDVLRQQDALAAQERKSLIAGRRYQEQIEELKFLNKTLSTQLEGEIEQHEKERDRAQTLLKKIDADGKCKIT